ncbi:hypothetical protein TIFTF001_052731 [Ficus carica]|uniref:ATP synthase subunit 9, mitochondrial n=1 Tax=Ficus carica TaxID=3494 RepID=A0AA88ED92_FICCA|nr:hypothetical protein TIFTF001_052731 [Ficus carica]
MSTVEALGIPKENIGGAPIEFAKDGELSLKEVPGSATTSLGGLNEGRCREVQRESRVENLMKRDEAEPSERAQKKVKTDGEEQCIKVTLPDEGAKSMGAGAATIASAGAAVGIGNVFSSLIHSVARNPSLAKQSFGYAILGFALTEAIASFAPMMAFLISSVFQSKKEGFNWTDRLFFIRLGRKEGSFLGLA